MLPSAMFCTPLRAAWTIWSWVRAFLHVLSGIALGGLAASVWLRRSDGLDFLSNGCTRVKKLKTEGRPAPEEYDVGDYTYQNDAGQYVEEKARGKYKKAKGEK
jgi:hypothetical protein